MIRYFIILLNLLSALMTGYAQPSDQEWPVFRGKPDLTGFTSLELPSSPELIWSLKTGTRTKSSPVVSDGLIIFGNDKGSVIAVGTDGKKRWQYEGGTATEAPPMVYGDRIIIGFNDGTLHAIDKKTGKLAWKYKTDNQIVGSANSWSTGKKSGIIIGSYDYFLHSVDPLNGRLQWKLETMNYVNGTPAVSNNNIVFGGCDGFIRIADAYTGREKDTIEIGTYIASSPALSGTKAFFGDYDGNLYCIDLLTGKTDWWVPASETSLSIIAIPAIGKNVVIVGNEDKYLY
jgi:outer membrane protein assembly factor BamB